MVTKALSDESMSDFPLVSVIVPVYNMERYLAETLESVLKSDYPNFEVIVVDDGSEDNSRAIAEEFVAKDHRVKLISQPNGGVSSARNNGIKSAKGEFILPVDSDNLISKDYIRKAALVLIENPKVKVVSCQVDFFGERVGREKTAPFSLRALCRHNMIDNCAMYRKKDWIESGGYCEELKGREDWDFWLSLFERGGDFIRLPIVGLYYRYRSDSKRIATRKWKREFVDIVNIRHKPLLYSILGGKLHYRRKQSFFRNKIKSWFYPQQVYAVNTDPLSLKIVYAANEKDKEKYFYLNKINKEISDTIVYYVFEDKQFHLPWSKIRKSRARNLFDSSNMKHLGYYEEQVSFFKLKSYLVIKDNEN